MFYRFLELYFIIWIILGIFVAVLKINNESEYKAISARIDELLEVVDNNTLPDDKNLMELNILSGLTADDEVANYRVLRSKIEIISGIKESMDEIKNGKEMQTQNDFLNECNG